MAYVVAVHVPIAGLALLPVVFGWPLVLFPVHIVFLELVIDPACSIAFEAEPEEPGLMRRPPRRVGASLFSRKLLVMSLLQGTCLLAVTLVVFRIGWRHSSSESSARALAFAALIAGNVALILVNRSWERSLFATLVTRNLASWAVILGASAMLVLVLEVPFLRELFHFGPVGGGALALALLAGFLALSWFEIWKLFSRRAAKPMLGA
jgi:Ca2+-transporting ATPase